MSRLDTCSPVLTASSLRSAEHAQLADSSELPRNSHIFLPVHIKSAPVTPAITLAMPEITLARPAITLATPVITIATPVITLAMSPITRAMSVITQAMLAMTQAMPVITTDLQRLHRVVSKSLLVHPSTRL